MNAFEFIHQYWRLLTDYVNPVPIAASALLWMIIAALGMLLLLLIFRKRVLVKRANTGLRVVSIAYFVVLPIAAGYFGFKWGLLRGLRNDLCGHAAVQLRPLDSAFSKTAAGYLAPLGQVGNLSLAEVVTMSTDYVWTAYMADLERRSNTGGFTGVASSMLIRFAGSSMVERSVKSKLRSLVAAAIGSESAADIIIETKMNSLLDKGMLSTIAVFEIDAIFKGLMRSVVRLFCLVLVLPLAEILVALYLVRRRRLSLNKTA